VNISVTDVDGYLATVAEPARSTLTALRRDIHSIAPEAVESISYGMPAFKYRGKVLVYFGAAKKHCALYGLPMDRHREKMAAFETSKGTIRFPQDKPFPEPLLRSLLEERMNAIQASSRG
jgi:uncharacterized protein YdhG (YjbR/CyaY superfamily)